MKIVASKEAQEQFLDEKWVNIEIGDYRLYLELTNDNTMWYVELIKMENGKTKQGYAFDITDFELLMAKKPNDPSYYHNYPLCPNCRTYMIYHFEHCPKCGQKLDWSGFTGET